MHTIGDMVKALNRSAVYPQGLQKRFELPVLKSANYSDAYLKASSSLRSSIPAEIPQLRTTLRVAKRFSPRS